MREQQPVAGDERTRIAAALEAENGNRDRAAARLGVSRTTLWRRMKRHGLLSDGA